MADWVVLEQWKVLTLPDGDQVEQILLVISGFKNSSEADHYAKWIRDNQGNSELAWAGFAEAKRPDPRYLKTRCPHDCDLRVMHEGEHQRF